MNIFNKYSYVWVTALFFLLSIGGYWVFGWLAYTQEQMSDNKPVEVDEYVNRTLRDMFESWQSEFLQLIWQVAGLAFLIYVDSPQSKDGDERKEEKLDLILKSINPEEADRLIKDLDLKYPRK